MKYKLIKEYPGSPKLGYIDDLNKSGHNNQGEYVQSMYDKNPEFWEKVVEKNYEILSLARFCSIKPTITDVSDYGDEFIEAMLKCDNARIHSVKRNDGEIFTIGDKTNFGLISKIVINNNSLSFYFEQKSCGYNLQTLIKWKQLFTTEDCVDIFEGDKYYSVNKTYWIVNEPENTCKINYETYHKNTNNFSTKEKAEEYILLNKPCLSYNEVLKAVSIKNKNTFETLKTLVKSKIQQSV